MELCTRILNFVYHLRFWHIKLNKSLNFRRINKKNPDSNESGSCALGGIQTHDLQNRNLTFYSAELRGQLLVNSAAKVQHFFEKTLSLCESHAAIAAIRDNLPTEFLLSIHANKISCGGIHNFVVILQRFCKQRI